MAHLGTLRDYRFEDQADDIRGTTLYGSNNDKLGKIDDVIFDHANGELKYVIVDTGGWLSAKRFMVPAGRVRPHNEKENEYITALSKKQIETFPKYDEENLKDEKRWKEYEGDYRRASGFEETGGVLHQAGGTNILVPDSIPAEGSASSSRTGKPVSGYKSPIHHRGVGMMDTTPIGVGQNADDQRLTFVPDAIGADRGDVKGTPVVPPSSGSQGKSAQATGNPQGSEIVQRGEDWSYQAHTGIEPSGPERTIEGDAIFNNEDVAGRKPQPANVHDTDVPSYNRVGGAGTETTEGRLPTYPDANQGQRWARFEENLRRDRPKIVGRCSVCEDFQNRRREDVA